MGLYNVEEYSYICQNTNSIVRWTRLVSYIGRSAKFTTSSIEIIGRNVFFAFYTLLERMTAIIMLHGVVVSKNTNKTLPPYSS